MFGGLDVGSAVGLVLCGPIIKHLGWPCVFYLFAVLGVLWTIIFPRLNPDEPDMLVPSELQPDSPGKLLRTVSLVFGAYKSTWWGTISLPGCHTDNLHKLETVEASIPDISPILLLLYALQLRMLPFQCC